MYCWLDGKTVVVTGASGGMGAGIAATLIKKHGCTVIGVARSEPKMLKFIEELGPTYAQQFSYKLFDVSVKENWENFYNELVEEGVQVDVLVNNAGICKLNKVLDFGRADWDPMIDVNLTAAFELSYEAAKIMIPQKSGKIINICSLFSYLGGQWSPAYSATKHALAGFTKAYCDELGQYNIQVNGIAPGYYATDITLATRSNPETNQRVLDHIPANRWGDTQDLMGAAVFLASQASNYVNGHLLVVDGGYLVR